MKFLLSIWRHFFPAHACSHRVLAYPQGWQVRWCEGCGRHEFRNADSSNKGEREWEHVANPDQLFHALRELVAENPTTGPDGAPVLKSES